MKCGAGTSVPKLSFALLTIFVRVEEIARHRASFEPASRPGVKLKSAIEYHASVLRENPSSGTRRVESGSRGAAFNRN